MKPHPVLEFPGVPGQALALWPASDLLSPVSILTTQGKIGDWTRFTSVSKPAKCAIPPLPWDGYKSRRVLLPLCIPDTDMHKQYSPWKYVCFRLYGRSKASRAPCMISQAEKLLGVFPSYLWKSLQCAMHLKTWLSVTHPSRRIYFGHVVILSLQVQRKLAWCLAQTILELAPSWASSQIRLKNCGQPTSQFRWLDYEPVSVLVDTYLHREKLKPSKTQRPTTFDQCDTNCRIVNQTCMYTSVLV